MEYIMKSGNLFLNDTLLVRIKSTFAGSEKKIFAADGELLMLTDICNLKAPLNERGNIVTIHSRFDGTTNKAEL